MLKLGYIERCGFRDHPFGIPDAQVTTCASDHGWFWYASNLAHPQPCIPAHRRLSLQASVTLITYQLGTSVTVSCGYCMHQNHGDHMQVRYIELGTRNVHQG